MIKFRKTITLLTTLLLFLSVNTSAFANSFTYTNGYLDSKGEWTIPWIQLKSPARSTITPATSVYPVVNSMNNQPRSVGSRPHQGTDLGMAVAIDDQIGKIADTANNGGYAVHMHFGITTAAITAASFDYETIGSRYKTVSAWNYGQHLDTLTEPYYNTSTHELFISSYTMNDGHLQEHSKVELWYKVGTATTWSVVQMSKSSYMNDPKSPYASQAYRWVKDLDTIATVGQTIKWYIVGYRNIDSPTYDTYCEIGESNNAGGICNSTEAHNWALFPALYTHPDYNGNNFPVGTPVKFETHIV
jgi:hypothetical protein